MKPVYWKLSLSLAKLLHVFCRDYIGPVCNVEVDDDTCLFAEDKDQWTGLVDLNLLPICVHHGGTCTCLRVNFNLLCAIRVDGYKAQINLNTQSKPMVWSDAYKCCFFFCLLYKMCYFALNLLKNTFLKN